MCVALTAALPAAGWAAPAADLVVVWAPGARRAPIEDVARRAGAAVIDRSPAASAVPATASILKRGATSSSAWESQKWD